MSLTLWASRMRGQAIRGEAMGLYPIYIDLDNIKPNKQDIERKLAMLGLHGARVYWRRSSHKNHYHLRVEIFGTYSISNEYFLDTLIIRALLNDDAKRIASDLRRMVLYPSSWQDRVNRLFDYKISKGKMLKAGRWHRLL